MKLSASFSVNKKKTTKLENDTDESKRKGKKSETNESGEGTSRTRKENNK